MYVELNFFQLAKLWEGIGEESESKIATDFDGGTLLNILTFPVQYLLYIHGILLRIFHLSLKKSLYFSVQVVLL
jgi:hypothetical protein